LPLAAFLLALSAGPLRAQCPGDLDGDGTVTIEEIVAIVNAALYGCPVPGATPSCPGDLNGDGIVNMRDVAIAARNFGQQYP
jgi:hypothetical protein